MASTSRTNFMYIYDLPYTERNEIIHILDQNNKWEELAGKYMKFSMMEIQNLRQEFQRQRSPTDELLTKWGHSNHTVAELFILLSKMHHYQAMRILKPFVDPECHRLLHEGEMNLTHLFNMPSDRKPTTPVTCPARNSKRSLDGSDEEAGLMSTAAAVIPPVDPSPNKTMGYGEHNLNQVTKSSTRLPAVDKVHLPEPAQEEKIINVENIRPQTNQIPPRKLSNASDASSMAESCGSIPHIPYKELMAATQGWDKQTILGKGGFGTVFKGNWKHTQVAIKRIEQRGAESAESYQDLVDQSVRELRILNSCRHDNILPVYGYSVGGEEPCLVYQFMTNGTLEDRLLCRKGSKPMSWLQRHNIAEGTARGLQFLHNSQTPFIHGDIKSANILLDVNMEPRIGDFGLAREGPQSQYTHMTISRVHGTRPYIPDEFMRSKKLSPEVDTFSFGIVMFEVASGLRAYDDHRPNKFLKEYVESLEPSQLHKIVDKRAGVDDQQTFDFLIKLGKWCSSRLAKERPKMEMVLKQLAGMTAKRLITAHVQGSMSPTSPYGMQVYHDLRNSQLRQQPTPGQTFQPPSATNGTNHPAAALAGEANVRVLPNVKYPNNPLLIYTPPQDQMFVNQPPVAATNGLPLNNLTTGNRNPTPSPTGSLSPQPQASPDRVTPTPSISSTSDLGSDNTISDEESQPATSNAYVSPQVFPQDEEGAYLPNLSLLNIKSGPLDAESLLQSSTKALAPTIASAQALESSSAIASAQTFESSSVISSASSSEPTAKKKSLIFDLAKCS